MKIMVLDGQGGGVGRALIELLRRQPGFRAEILAVGTNSAATAGMLKAGADEGSTGENAVIFCAPRCDVITGSIGILAANSMLGEISPAMARAVAESPAEKVLVPMNRCGITIAGIPEAPLPRLLEEAARAVAAKAAAKQ